jgi:hypothetical protein
MIFTEIEIMILYTQPRVCNCRTDNGWTAELLYSRTVVLNHGWLVGKGLDVGTSASSAILGPAGVLKIGWTFQRLEISRWTIIEWAYRPERMKNGIFHSLRLDRYVIAHTKVRPIIANLLGNPSNSCRLIFEHSIDNQSTSPWIEVGARIDSHDSNCHRSLARGTP